MEYSFGKYNPSKPCEYVWGMDEFLKEKSEAQLMREENEWMLRRQATHDEHISWKILYQFSNSFNQGFKTLRYKIKDLKFLLVNLLKFFTPF